MFRFSVGSRWISQSSTFPPCDPSVARPGGFVELLGDDYGVDAAAADAGTIGYEILTALGRRYHRVYRGASGLPSIC